jgi:hypothetical protein
MPRQLQDNGGRVNKLDIVVPISNGGTAADNAPQAVINLQGISRTRIDAPHGVAGADHQGYLDRKYLEGVGIYSGITLEGQRLLAYSEPGNPHRPVFFISNYHSASPPTILINDPVTQATLVQDGQYFTFQTPLMSSGVVDLKININERDYQVWLYQDKAAKPEILNNQHVLSKSFFFIESSMFKSLSPGNVGTPETWTVLEEGETEIAFKDTDHSLYIQGWCGENGQLVVDLGDEVFSFPKSMTRLRLSPKTARTIKIRMANAEHAKIVLMPNTLAHESTDWDVARDRDFTDIALSFNRSPHLTRLPVTLDNGEYFVRCNHRAFQNGVSVASEWSQTARIRVDSELNALNEYGVITDLIHPVNAAYGTSVAINQDYVLVGAPLDNTTFNNAGAVLVYRREDFIHRYTNRITAPEHLAESKFGTSISLTDTNKLFVGAPGVDGVGVVHQFNLVDEQAVFIRDIPARSQSVAFGTSVLAVGEHLLIGDPRNTTNGIDAGAVHVYKDSETGYQYQSTIYPTTPAPADNFGVSLAATEDLSHVFIGAASPDINSSTFGKFYVFSQTNGVFEESLVRDSVHGIPGSRFARSLSYNDKQKTLYVGCEGDDAMGPGAGSVHVYNCTLDTIINVTHMRTMYAASPQTQGMFGASLANSKDGFQLYVGSRGFKLNDVQLGGVFFFT